MDHKTVIKELGGAPAVARRLSSPKKGRRSLTAAAVYKWTRIPVERVHEIVKLSGGRFTAEQLRPDIFTKAA